MYEFDYHRPASLAEVANLLGARPDAKIVAGGMTLVPTLKLRLAKPSDLIDLAAIPALRGISDAGDALVIGAMTRHAEVNRSPLVKAGIPALAALAAMIGDPAVRNRGTIGGSIANNDPAADYPAAVRRRSAPRCARQAARSPPTISLPACSRRRWRRPRSSPRCGCRSRRPPPTRNSRTRRRATRSSASSSPRTAGGVRVAVTGAGPCVFRVPAMETALAASFTPEAIKDIAIPDAGLNTDIHASAEYRAHLVGVMARRAVAACA